MASLSDETAPLIPSKEMHGASAGSGSVRISKWRSLPRRIAVTVWNSINLLLRTLAAPGVYIVACFYDENGNFSPFGSFHHLSGHRREQQKKSCLPPYIEVEEKYSVNPKTLQKHRTVKSTMSSFLNFGSKRPFPQMARSGSSYAVTSESESDSGTEEVRRHRTRNSAKGWVDGDEASSGGRGSSTGQKPRSIRIKLNDDSLRQRKHCKEKSSHSSLRSSHDDNDFNQDDDEGGGSAKDILAQLKSPLSPVSSAIRYSHGPTPPRPLIPRRQPSFLSLEPLDKSHQKTLILDLDETLIHSMSKDGRMSTGHMVEVRLNTTFVGVGGQPSAGPQHPILYYVHKRPFCDEFLRRVCKWYNLVVFTASVQEYADPVIDWLESERKFFSARYYRQHCTFRHGAFIKDLSSVEPDLSKVMILDNSPLSYMFHPDNAIPIQGWVSDHTDSDLLHLVPVLEGLQYVPDVRALLSLRSGEGGRHMA
ncbi:MAG: Nuclear envelope morphology protein 1 [Sporothrix epigloea]